MMQVVQKIPTEQNLVEVFRVSRLIVHEAVSQAMLDALKMGEIAWET